MSKAFSSTVESDYCVQIIHTNYTPTIRDS